MSKEEIEDILEELHLVRPEILAPKAKKLFKAIMSIADERDKFQQENQELKKQLEERKYYKFYKYENNPCGSDYCFCERPCDSNMNLKCFFENGEICGFMSETLVSNHDNIEEISLNEFAHDFIKPLINANFQNKNQQKVFIHYLEDEIKEEKDNLEKLCELCKIPKENNGAYKFAYSYIKKIEEILQKYKEIIGVSNDY